MRQVPWAADAARRRSIFGLGVLLGVMVHASATAFTFALTGDGANQTLSLYWESYPPYVNCGACPFLWSSDGVIPLESHGINSLRSGGLLTWTAGDGTLTVAAMTSAWAGALFNNTADSWAAVDARSVPLDFLLVRQSGEPSPLIVDLYIRPRLIGTVEQFSFAGGQADLVLQLAMAVKVNGVQVSRDSLYEQSSLVDGEASTQQVAFLKGTLNYVVVPNVMNGSDLEIRIWAYMRATAWTHATIDAYNSSYGNGPTIVVDVMAADAVAVPTDQVPAALELSGRPNPASGSARISYAVARPGPVRLSIYDVQGHRVATLVDRVEEAGRRQVQWSATTPEGGRLAAGVYVVELVSGTERRVGKLVLLGR